MKVCTKCKVEKETSEFNRQKACKDGYTTSCKDCLKKYFKNNKEKLKEYYRVYNQINKDERVKYQKKYIKKRLKEDNLYKFKNNIRSNVRTSFTRRKNKLNKNTTIEFVLGCTLDEFINYIQSKFTKGMTFKNHGKWHLDHIIPLCNANTQEEITNLCHYTNYQPLWAEENLSKSKKILNK
jgi:hypothetical protein